MKDEIKETIEYKINFLTKSLDIGIPTKNRRYFNDIKIYITNLQQENERLKEWKEDLLKENIELENIRKEAIEYIRSNEWAKDYEISNCRTHLLNILQNGSDNK